MVKVKIEVENDESKDESQIYQVPVVPENGELIYVMWGGETSVIQLSGKLWTMDNLEYDVCFRGDIL